jgi:phosphoenolpyruvate-protein kinase (PTS system EI component)
MGKCRLRQEDIAAREYGIPAVVNVGPASRLIRTGQTLRVDGDRGTVTILDDEIRTCPANPIFLRAAGWG